MDDFTDERDELCRRFRESLAKPISERFYDEDELVELFDYAGDLNDDYLRMEILLCGARFYPDSEELRLRRAIFYNGFESDAEAKFYQDNNGSGPLWDILRLRYADVQGDELVKTLDNLLTTYAEFDDEEIIQLVNVATQLGQFEWVLDRIDAIRAHTGFPLTLHYEVAVLAEDAAMYDKAVEMLELLTDEDPSNAEQWFMLAQNYDRCERAEDALNAVDFALALLPRNKQMRAFRAGLFFKLDRSLELALRELDDIREDFPDDPDLLQLYCNINDKVNGEADTLLRLGKMADCDKPPYAALTLYLLRLSFNDTASVIQANRLLDAFYLSNESEGTNTRENWQSWARFCVDAGQLTLAFSVLHCYVKNSNDDLAQIPLYLELAVKLHFNTIALNTIARMEEVRGKAYYRGNVEQSILYVTMMMRSGQFDNVSWMIENIDAAEYGNPERMGMEERMCRKLFLVMMAEIHRKLQLPQYRTSEAWKVFDPLD